MHTIKALPKEVRQLIAAGEVIDTPVAVFKELIENALDAQATEIQITVADARFQTITVEDNGFGISKQDLQATTKKYFTSKLSQLKDLDSLTSLGFRGEALASIAAVAKVQISSRTKDSPIGYRYATDTKQVQAQSMAVGTIVKVADLFSPIPARKAVLQKQYKQYQRKILTLLHQLCYVYPSIAIRYTYAGSLSFQSPPQQSSQQRLLALHPGWVDTVVSIDSKNNGYHLQGLFLHPSAWLHTQPIQLLTIAGRLCHEEQIEAHINTLARKLQTHGNPSYLIQIKVPEQAVDLNIHPRKLEVNLYEPQPVLDLITEAIQQAWNTQMLHQNHYQPVQPRGSVLRDHLRKELYNTRSLQLVGETQRIWNTYLVQATTQGLYLIDQHAMHERILFDTLQAIYAKKQEQLRSNLVDVSVVFDLPIEIETLDEIKPLLQELGMQVEAFGPRSIRISKVPAVYAEYNLGQLLRELLTDGIDTQSQAIIASLACRMAVKAGDVLEKELEQKLVHEVLENPNSNTCPHGRPASVLLRKADLEKLFKRRA